MVGSITPICQLWGWRSQPRAPSVSAPWWLWPGFCVDSSSTCCSPITWVGGRFQRGGWSLSSYLKHRLFKNSLILLEKYILHILWTPPPPFHSAPKWEWCLLHPGQKLVWPSPVDVFQIRVLWGLCKRMIHTLELLNLYEPLPWVTEGWDDAHCY